MIGRWYMVVFCCVLRVTRCPAEAGLWVTSCGLKSAGLDALQSVSRLRDRRIDPDR
jgi:hypothetical protein